MKILENIPLAQYTTFKIGGPARFFCRVQSEDELMEAVTFAKENFLPIFVLGGGSNLLISDKGFSGLVIKVELKGVSYVDDRVTAAAGEMWDSVVEDTVNRGLYGLENLSAIPGTVGAAPVQNIGAYGAEISKVLESVRVLEVETLAFVNLSNSDCRFQYRDSVFKQQKGKFIVTSCVFKLDKNGKVNISYKDLVEFFQKKSLASPSLEEVRQAVIDIRWNKLPDWNLWGTAGSFFKNPVLPLQQYIDLRQRYPDLPSFPECDGKVKVSLAWIIDKICGFRGGHLGNVYVYEKQALVIVSKPGATASEVVSLTSTIMDRVKEKTGLKIEAEVEWVN